MAGYFGSWARKIMELIRLEFLPVMMASSRRVRLRIRIRIRSQVAVTAVHSAAVR